MKRNVCCFFIVNLACIISLWNCQKEEISPRDFPRVNTSEVTNITDEGATFNAEIIFKGNNIIKEYGFVWDSAVDPLYDFDNKAFIQQDAGTGKYNLDITNSLKRSKYYYIKAYVKTNEYIVYGRQVSFLSQGCGAPSITEIYPSTGRIFDTVTIHGKGFSQGSANVVRFDTCVASVLYATGSVLTVRVPELLLKENNVVSVSIFGNVARAPQEFKLLQPILTDYFPKTGTFGDTVRLAVQNFPRITEIIRIKFETCSATVIETTDEQITCLVPDGIPIPDPVISVCPGKRVQAFPDNFHLLPPEIHSFTPAEADNVGITITLTGNNFNPVPAFNTVYFRDKKAEVSHAERHELQVLVPDELIGSPDVTVIDTVRISVETAGQRTVSSSVFSLRYLSRWTKMADFPGSGRIHPVSWGINGKGYFGLGNHKSLGTPDNTTLLTDFWEFDPDRNLWTRKADFPGNGRVLCSSFVLHQKIYVCFGMLGENNLSNEVWEYDPEVNEWTRKADFPGIIRYGAMSFAVNNMGYIGGGIGIYDFSTLNLVDFWQYDAISDTWTEKGEIPNDSRWEFRVLQGFDDGEKGYLVRISSYFVEFQGWEEHREWWQYDPSSDKWHKITTMPGLNESIAGFGIDGIIFAGFSWYNGGTQVFNKYDPITDQWTEIGFPGKRRYAAGAFKLGNKGFICGGMSDDEETHWTADCVDLWMFDPIK